jgi:hypothetical protein
MHWLLEDFDVDPLLHAGLSQSLLQQLFDNPATYLIIKPGHQGEDALLPKATRVYSFASYARMQAAVNGSAIPSGTHYLLYDNESWSATPSNEQADPLHYAQLADALAHAHGYSLIFTPAADLVPRLSHTYNSKSRFSGYLSMSIASGARYSDVFDIQAQQIEAQPQFEQFVTSAVAQARAANPSVQIIVGLTTAVPGSGSVSASTILNAFDQAKSQAAGFWLNIPGGPSVGGQAQGAAAGVSFLESVAHQLG